MSGFQCFEKGNIEGPSSCFVIVLYLPSPGASDRVKIAVRFCREGPTQRKTATENTSPEGRQL